MQNCKKASKTDEKARKYIDILLSSVEYETFVKLMKIMKPVAERRRLQHNNAESKDGERHGNIKRKLDDEKSPVKALAKEEKGSVADAKLTDRDADSKALSEDKKASSK